MTANSVYLHDEEDCLTEKEIAYFKERLLQKRREVLAESDYILRSDKMILDRNDMKDEVDLASIAIQQDVTFRLLDRSRKLLAEIQRALKKIDNGDFGICEGTGEPIPKKRLELAPWVRHSVEHKEQLELVKKRQPKKTSGANLSIFARS